MDYKRVKELFIKGIKIFPEKIDTFGDDRGYFSAINFNPNSKRAYLIKNHRAGIVRAFHGHKNESKTFYILEGGFKVIIINMETGDWNIFNLTEKHNNKLYVPAGAYNGFVSLDDNSEALIFTNSSFEESIKDDFRKPYDLIGKEVWEIEHR